MEGKVAFVTGAARGQGRSHAVRLAQEGADIIAMDICRPIPHLQYPPATPEDLAQTVKQVEALDRRIVAAEADVRDRDAMKQILDDGVAELGRLDVVIANAGICYFGPWDETTPEIWQLTIDINLTGVWNTVHLAVPHLITGGRGGSIVLTSSTAGLKGQPFLTPYVAAKHGVVGIMRAFAHELAEHHIRVNSVHPTGCDTPMGTGAGVDRLQELLEERPQLAGMYQNALPVDSTDPVDVSNAVLFLASDEARYITGVPLPVDAGSVIK